MEHNAIPELTNITPLPNATVNSAPDAEAFLQELTNYTEVYIEGNNHENHSVRVT